MKKNTIKSPNKKIVKIFDKAKRAFIKLDNGQNIICDIILENTAVSKMLTRDWKDIETHYSATVHLSNFRNLK